MSDYELRGKIYDAIRLSGGWVSSQELVDLLGGQTRANDVLRLIRQLVQEGIIKSRTNPEPPHDKQYRLPVFKRQSRTRDL